MASNVPDDGVLVVGLGRFGIALAETLMDLGHQVLGVDADPANVQRNADLLTHVVEADGTDEEAMRQLGAGEFGRAVVGIGTDLEASRTSGPRRSRCPTAASCSGSAPTTWSSPSTTWAAESPTWSPAG